MNQFMTKPHVGDRVSVDSTKYPGVWIVKSVGKVNATIEPENGGRGLRAPFSMLLPPNAEQAPIEFYSAGEIIRILDGKYAGLYVVIADKGDDKINVAKLGGDGGRYIRALRGRNLVKVPAKEVLK